MSNSLPHGSSGGPPLPPYTSTQNAAHSIFRRSSYASVLSGTPASVSPQPPHAPQRSGFMNQPSTSYPPPQSSAHHTRNISRGMETEGLGSNIANSWGRAGQIPSYGNHWTGFGNGLDEPKSPPFFIPSYMRASRHAERLYKAHGAKLAAQRDARSAHSSNAGSLSTSSSSINLHKMVPSHRGMTHDIIERAPAPVYEDSPAPLPSRWNQNDKYSGLDLMLGGLEVRYNGLSKTHDEAAAARADYPMPKECGIYYFEVTVISKGKEGLISIGFSGPKVTLNRLPGWEPESWAYHGDDGMTFCCTASGRPYGPKYSTSDVIGCGVNFRTGQAFFTKNGVNLGTAFTSIKGDRLYPSVGMKKPNEHLRVNFGQSQFVFDIDSLVEMERLSVMDQINKTSVTSLCPPLNETQLIHRLIAQYLAHDGYIDTARAFAAEVRQENQNLVQGISTAPNDVKDLEPEEDVDAIQRQKIRASILEGDIDLALRFMDLYYPNVLHENENIYFKMRCRKFIEMIRRCAELSDGTSPTLPPHKSHNDDYNGVFDHQMELDDQFGNGTKWDDGANMDISDDGGGTTLGNGHVGYSDMMQKTLDYGRLLNDEFGRDPRREVKKALEDTLAFIAYTDPRECPLSNLLEERERIPVAEELNGAILVSLGKSSSSALERLFAQTDVLLEELGADGGAGALINLRSKSDAT